MANTSYSSSPGAVYNGYEAPESAPVPLPLYPTQFSHSESLENWLDPSPSFTHGNSRSFFHLQGHPQFGRSAETGTFSGNSNVSTFNEWPSNAGIGMPVTIGTNASEQTVCSLRPLCGWCCGRLTSVPAVPRPVRDRCTDPSFWGCSQLCCCECFQATCNYS